jgi:hypothetical protein
LLFRFAPGTTAEQIRALADGLAGLPAAIPSIRWYGFGPDLALREGAADFALVADFDDEAGWRKYLEHPAHARLVAELLEPIMGERVSAQIDLGDRSSSA